MGHSGVGRERESERKKEVGARVGPRYARGVGDAQSEPARAAPCPSTLDGQA